MAMVQNWENHGIDVQYGRCIRTNLNNPSATVVKNICYPTQDTPYVPALVYGLKFEKTALQEIKTTLESTHINFEVNNCGVIVSSVYPFAASTPDALCCCECCGPRVIEIKCPYNLRNGQKVVDLKLSDPYLKKLPDASWYLDKNHTYYYQVQLEIFTTNRDHCFFFWRGTKMI